MNKRILYFCTSYSSFVNKDIAILKHEYTVKPFLFSVKNKYLIPLVFIKQKLFILVNIFRADVVVCQFAGYHSYLPVLLAKLFFKPSLIVLGGTDCVGFPSIRYGNFQKALLSTFTKWSCRLADYLSPVHETLMLCDYSYQEDDYSKQGLLFHIPGLKTKYEVICNGYDDKKWFRNSEKKKNTFITVAADLKMKFSVKLKGIDLILEVAKSFPECEFIIIGADETLELPANSTNIKRISVVENKQLISYYSGAEFYLQLSMSEGFPNALSEAMLCECIPIVSAVGAMPEIAGGIGFVLKSKDVDQLKELIKKALSSERSDLSKKARERIQKKYPESLRKERLLSLLSKMTRTIRN